MLGATIVRLVKVGLVVGMDDHTLAAAVDGVVAEKFATMVEELMNMMTDDGGEEQEEPTELENNEEG